MTPYYKSGTVQIFHGDVLAVLREMPDRSVNCCVTSPPYWGLRDYGIEPSVWGGDASCAHDFAMESVDTEVGKGNWAQGVNGRGELQPGGVAAKRKPLEASQKRGFCIHCNAWKGHFGLEPTPELFIEHAVTIFREVRRVLRDDGTLWLNIGDSYAASPGQRKQGIERNDVAGWKQQTNRGCLTIGSSSAPGLKPKDLVGIPWMLAFALRADGWYLRQDIIWHKPNPMPESVIDRCTKAHEYIFLMSKSQRYYYDQEAVREVCSTGSGSEDEAGDQKRRYKMPDGWDTAPGGHGAFHRNGREKGKTPGRNSRIFVDRDPRHSPERKGRASGNKSHKGVTEYECSETEEHRTKAGLLKISSVAYPTRNKRSVWTVATEPFPEAHFATFPTDLIRPCILAGCPLGGVVLDPFVGSGTTAMVARSLNCRSIGIELNAEYIEIAKRRLCQETFEFTPEGELSAT